MKRIALLGSTGSIGRQVLECVKNHSDEFEIVSLAANSSAELFEQQMNLFKPKYACLSDPQSAQKIKSVPSGTNLFIGDKALLHAVCAEADIVFVAVVGFCGLQAVIEAIKMEKTIALANKEALVAGGYVVKQLLEKYPKAKLIPVDSEHSALWQSLNFDTHQKFKKLILTASGGAFRDKTLEELKYVTAEDALKHPNWTMGKKITIDCATMLNKGLEVIEARWLFDAPYEKIDVVVHKESVIHSMVEYDDGAVICELANPSMEIPIQLALSYPKRLSTTVKSYDFLSKPLTFEAVDHLKYPCFDLVLKAAEKGNVYPCALSAANEIAVGLFLDGKIPFLSIKDYISDVLEKITPLEVTFESLNAVDNFSRQAVREMFEKTRRI